MPPKKKSKTSTPATLPCFATARLTIIGANPVQRKIWQKCGGPTFLKPSQVSQLTNDRDYVVIASNVDASTVQSKKGAARVVTDRWLTASIERNALQDAAAHAWPPPSSETEAPPPPPGLERPVRCVAYDCDAEWVAAVRGLVGDHRPHVVLLRGATAGASRPPQIVRRSSRAATGVVWTRLSMLARGGRAPATCLRWATIYGIGLLIGPATTS